MLGGGVEPPFSCSLPPSVAGWPLPSLGRRWIEVAPRLQDLQPRWVIRPPHQGVGAGELGEHRLRPHRRAPLVAPDDLHVTVEADRELQVAAQVSAEVPAQARQLAFGLVQGLVNGQNRLLELLAAAHRFASYSSFLRLGGRNREYRDLGRG